MCTTRDMCHAVPECAASRNMHVRMQHIAEYDSACTSGSRRAYYEGKGAVMATSLDTSSTPLSL